jgi:orotate phosphoribosyltransferase
LIMASIGSKSDFILGLINSNLLSFGKITATSAGNENPYYLDLRAIYSYPVLLDYAVKWLRSAVADSQHEYLCGIETASLPLVGAYGLRYMESTLYLRTKKKPYGHQKVIEGHFDNGDKILLVDDLIVEPPVTLDFIALAEEAGAVVGGVYVLYEKLAPALSRNVFEDRGYEVKSLFTYKDVVRVLRVHRDRLGIDDKLVEMVDAFGSSS